MIKKGEPCCYAFVVPPEALAQYGRRLGISGAEAGLIALARSIAASPCWAGMSGITVVVRMVPQPILAILGSFDENDETFFASQVRGLIYACTRLTYVSYEQAEQCCRRLADQLIERFGKIELKRFRFVSMPRGGHIVLGLLAYALDLARDQLVSSADSHVPLVIVDDCAITGARFTQFIEQCRAPEIIFAHLYSHRDLRDAIQANERRVLACISAYDLRDHGPARYGSGYEAIREKCLRHVDVSRYWLGHTDHVCFAWNEPDWFFQSGLTGRTETGWRLVPPELCLKNRIGSGTVNIRVQVQPEGKGPLKPAEDVIFGENEKGIVVGNIKTGQSFILTDVAAAMWQAILEHGNLGEAATKLLQDYDVDPLDLQADLNDFVRKLFDLELIGRSCC